MAAKRASKNKTQRKRIGAKNKRRTGGAARRQNAQPIASRGSALSYEEAILKNIVDNSNHQSVPDEAFLLSATLSSVSGGLKEMHYKSGMSIGKSLYKLNNSKKKYSMTEEAVQDLASFFESAGHKVTYNAFPDKVEMTLHGSGAPDMGADLHAFEAGIISGYLSASERKLVTVSETDCINNDSDYCRFATDARPQRISYKSGGAEMIDKLTDHVVDRLKGKARYSSLYGARLAKEYHTLASYLLTDKDYSNSVNEIAAHLGNDIGTRIFDDRGHSSKMIDVVHAVKLLNLGNPVVEQLRPLHMSVAFDELSSRREFVDMSLSFINGLLSNGFDNVSVTERSEDNGYVVDIREKA